MGFAANFLTVASSISRLYDIDLQISQLQSRKLNIASMVDVVADRDNIIQKSQMSRLRQQFGLPDPTLDPKDPRSKGNGDANAAAKMSPQMLEWMIGQLENNAGQEMKRRLSQMEKQIDQKLEQLKAMRTALNSQKEEFQKYIQENIKSAFTNRYMGG